MAAEQILSVGIDIGTSTTQVIFSRLTVDNTAGYFSVPSVSIVDKQVIYAGRIYKTPLLDSMHIDGEAVRELVAAEFKTAGFTPADTKTGAVIITGESARKDNARVVLEKLSGFAGEFVVSTAGPDLEAIIAGKGSGTWQYSVDNACAAINIDIGGGTSNIVQFFMGETAAKGCVDIGGRQIRFDRDMRITYISQSAAKIISACGVPLAVGRIALESELKTVCAAMADLLFELAQGERSQLLRQVETAGSSVFAPTHETKAVFFSGGVAQCLHMGETDIAKYGDIGVLLAEAIRQSKFYTRYKICQSRETIRATVVGAGSYTTSVSGSTIFYSEALFPQRNLPALKLTAEEQASCLEGQGEALEDKLRWFMGQIDGERMLIALPGLKNPGYEELKNMAAAIGAAAEKALPKGAPLFLAVETDMAKALGQTVFTAMGRRRPVAAIDAVHIEQNDYIDLGKPLLDGLVIPVVVKTLIFG
ncbi:hypothetical protein SDC9_57539 [bioreactor metagenome]|uniref:Reactivating factor for ethanolamine ammonia lyase n=1 Tax=bioreactor metagenome TaxID=1076179 RepID=A0A644X4V7_9ZZZZ